MTRTLLTEILYKFTTIKLLINATFTRGSELVTYEIELQNRVTQNDVLIRVTDSKIFVEINLSSY